MVLTFIYEISYWRDGIQLHPGGRHLLEEESTPVFPPGESPWTREPGGLQFLGLQRVGHD